MTKGLSMDKSIQVTLFLSRPAYMALEEMCEASYNRCGRVERSNIVSLAVIEYYKKNIDKVSQKKR
jgi:hypothetical protein